ncbi:MAG: isocitrate/isopropylmalate dehydrogenase family protein [Chloroflexi bacterium]|nr:isocitrate/isopropylmalate dehydrogenase family protein [Chloroflexota bacterium]
MSYNITLIPGDGVGPEVTKATRRAIEATGVDIKWDLAVMGDTAQDLFGTPLPEYVFDSIRRNKVALKGPVTTPVGYGFRSVNVALRQGMDLYACLRPCKTYPGIVSLYDNVDLVIVRENTEDLYCGIEFERGSPEAYKLIGLVNDATGKQVRPDSGFSLKMISDTGTRKIVKFAFEYARKHGRKKVSAVHKANILKFSDGLFLSVARDVAKEYDDIEFEDVVVDTVCMRLVRRPQDYDVLVLPNLYGDFMSELTAGLVGGLGLAPGANLGDDIAVFEPTHGSAPKYAGKNKVNPMAMMLSGVMMLRHIGEVKAADLLESAIASVLKEGKSITYDIKSDLGEALAPVGTNQVGDAVVERVEQLKRGPHEK